VSNTHRTGVAVRRTHARTHTTRWGGGRCRLRRRKLYSVDRANYAPLGRRRFHSRLSSGVRCRRANRSADLLLLLLLPPPLLRRCDRPASCAMRCGLSLVEMTVCRPHLHCNELLPDRFVSYTSVPGRCSVGAGYSSSVPHLSTVGRVDACLLEAVAAAP
jgi:hypothetical protein